MNNRKRIIKLLKKTGLDFNEEKQIDYYGINEEDKGYIAYVGDYGLSKDKSYFYGLDFTIYKFDLKAETIEISNDWDAEKVDWKWYRSAELRDALDYEFGEDYDFEEEGWLYE